MHTTPGESSARGDWAGAGREGAVSVLELTKVERIWERVPISRRPIKTVLFLSDRGVGYVVVPKAAAKEEGSKVVGTAEEVEVRARRAGRAARSA